MKSPAAGSPAQHAPSSSLWSAFVPLLPLILAVFVGFLAIGMVLPVIPRHVHDVLGQGTAMVGVVMGSQYLASFFGRFWAGALADARGPRVPVLIGLVTASCIGAVYLLSWHFVERTQLSLTLVVLARLLTGVTDSFVITGVLAWGVARVGTAHTGKAFGWLGVALFGAYAVGPPLGVALHAHFGFGALAEAAVLVPIAALAGSLLIPAMAPSHLPRLPVSRVIGAVKWPGIGLLLCAAGFAMISAFAVLLFAQRGWSGGAIAVSSLGVGFVAGRLLFGHLPDRIGGARVALVCVLTECVGELLIWGAPGAVIACIGATLTGGGYGLAFQSFGVEAVRRAPVQNRGGAMGAYVAFQDISMGLAAPLGGILAQATGLASVYLAAAAAAAGAFVLTLAMLRQRI
jgi:MFS family permease